MTALRQWIPPLSLEFKFLVVAGHKDMPELLTCDVAYQVNVLQLLNFLMVNTSS